MKETLKFNSVCSVRNNFKRNSYGILHPILSNVHTESAVKLYFQH